MKRAQLNDERGYATVVLLGFVAALVSLVALSYQASIRSRSHTLQRQRATTARMCAEAGISAVHATLAARKKPRREFTVKVGTGDNTGIEARVKIQLPESRQRGRRSYEVQSRCTVDSPSGPFEGAIQATLWQDRTGGVGIERWSQETRRE